MILSAQWLPTAADWLDKPPVVTKISMVTKVSMVAT